MYRVGYRGAIYPDPFFPEHARDCCQRGLDNFLRVHRTGSQVQRPRLEPADIQDFIEEAGSTGRALVDEARKLN